MSYWIPVKKEDIDVDLVNGEVYLWLESDESGNRYASLKIDDLKEALKKAKSNKVK